MKHMQCMHDGRYRLYKLNDRNISVYDYKPYVVTLRKLVIKNDVRSFVTIATFKTTNRVEVYTMVYIMANMDI